MADAHIWHAIDRLAGMVTMLGPHNPGMKSSNNETGGGHHGLRSDNDCLSGLYKYLLRNQGNTWEVAVYDEATLQVMGSGLVYSNLHKDFVSKNFCITISQGGDYLVTFVSNVGNNTSLPFPTREFVLSALNVAYYIERSANEEA